MFTIKEVVPRSYDTPMFWDDDDLAELKGTAVEGLFAENVDLLGFLLTLFEDSLGKEQVEIDYREKIVPAIQVRFSFLLG